MLFRRSNLETLVVSLIVIVFTFLHIEYMYEKKISLILISIYIVSYLYTLIRNENKALFILLGYYILIPTFPRSILDDYTLLDNGLTYYTMHSITFGSFNILLLLTLFHAGLCMFKYQINKTQFNYVFVCIGVIILSLLLNMYFEHGILNAPKYNSFGVIKPFVYLLVGTIFFSNKRPEIVPFLIACSMILGYRVLFFGFGDIFIFDNLRLDFALSPYLTLSVYVMLIYNGYKLGVFHHIGFLLSLIYFSRALIMISFFLVICATFKSKRIKFPGKLKIMAIFSSLILSLPVILYYSNYRLYRFFIWKTNIINIFFADYEMSGSGKVRFIEFSNVFHEVSQNFVTLLFGKGINGTYTFNAYPMNISGVGLESYSSDQLNSGLYYTTHNFSSFFLLKLGLIGLILYIGTMLITTKTTKKINIIMLLVIVFNFLYNLWVIPILAIFYFNFFKLFTKKHKI